MIRKLINEEMISREKIFNILSEVCDPEIPVLSIVDLGIVRNVEIDRLPTSDFQLPTSDFIKITITPTYTGCPAMKVIEEDIFSAMKNNGFENVEIKTILSPAWTTDWLTEEGKEKLRQYGIAPPEKTTADKNILFGKSKEIACPLCGSLNTEMKSQFGSTACKSLYVCKNCKEPFDYFKCI